MANPKIVFERSLGLLRQRLREKAKKEKETTFVFLDRKAQGACKQSKNKSILHWGWGLDN